MYKTEKIKTLPSLGYNSNRYCQNCFWDESEYTVLMGLDCDICPLCNGRMEYGYD